MIHIWRIHLSVNCAKCLKGKVRQQRVEQGRVLGPGLSQVSGREDQAGEVSCFLKGCEDAGVLLQKRKQGDSPPVRG